MPSANRAGTHNQIPKKIKIFYNFLTPYPTTTYPLFLYAVRCPLYAISRPNAHLRPIVEGTVFFVPARSTEFLFSYSEFSVQCSEFRVQCSELFFMDLVLWDSFRTIECVYAVFVCADLFFNFQIFNCNFALLIFNF